jgi:hypothetical protein
MSTCSSHLSLVHTSYLASAPAKGATCHFLTMYRDDVAAFGDALATGRECR